MEKISRQGSPERSIRRINYPTSVVVASIWDNGTGSWWAAKFNPAIAYSPLLDKTCSQTNIVFIRHRLDAAFAARISDFEGEIHRCSLGKIVLQGVTFTAE